MTTHASLPERRAWVPAVLSATKDVVQVMWFGGVRMERYASSTVGPAIRLAVVGIRWRLTTFAPIARQLIRPALIPGSVRRVVRLDCVAMESLVTKAAVSINRRSIGAKEVCVANSIAV